jgi:hypothetical protein
MRIPSGDLAPMRKHRHGSSFRRRRSRWPAVLAVLAVLAVAAGAYGLTHRDDSPAPSTAAIATPCPSPVRSVAPAPAKAAPPARLPAPGQVSLRLLNGSGRDRLARVVGDELARRGFHVTAMGNAPRPLVGASRVYYGPGGRPAALLVTAHVLGATVQPVPTAARGAIDVVLGSTFVRVRTPAETSAYAHQLVTVGVPAPASAPEPTGEPVRAEGLLTRMFSGFRRAEDMVGVVRRVRAAGVKTALLSNSWGLDYPREGWEELFDVTVISGEVGMRKPEPEIYQLCADRLGVAPGACVFVDDLAPNVRGAVEVGMVGVLHRTHDETVAELEVLLKIDLTT